MALTAAQRLRVAELYYTDARGRRDLTEYAIIVELMTMILANPSAAQKTAIANFLTARIADSEAVEAGVPAAAAAAIAAQDARQVELTALETALG